MPLKGTEITLVKNWDTSLSTEDYDLINSVDLYIIEDPTPEKINAFNTAYEVFKEIDNPTEAQIAAFASTYYYKATMTKANNWTKTVAIAPGIYDGENFKTTGHTYAVFEPGIDTHYEYRPACHARLS